MIRRLYDSVTFTSTDPTPAPADMTVPAHVYSLSGSDAADPNRPGLIVTVMRVMVGPTPRPIDSQSDHVIHAGITYRIGAPAMARYRRGKIHHWTIDIERVDG